MSIFRNQFVSMTSDQIDLMNREEKAIGQFFSKEKEFAEIFGTPKPIDPPFPAVTPDNPSQEANGVAVLPFVNQQTGD